MLATGRNKHPTSNTHIRKRYFQKYFLKKKSDSVNGVYTEFKLALAWTIFFSYVCVLCLPVMSDSSQSHGL